MFKIISAAEYDEFVALRKDLESAREVLVRRKLSAPVIARSASCVAIVEAMADQLEALRIKDARQEETIAKQRRLVLRLIEYKNFLREQLYRPNHEEKEKAV